MSKKNLTKQEADVERNKSWKKLPHESIVQYLARIIKLISWGFIITFIITVPGAIVSCLVLLDRCNNTPTDELKVSTDEMLKDSIARNISIIEATFHPEDIPQDIDSTAYPDIILIKNFKLYSLEYSNCLRELYNTPRVTKYKDKSLKDIIKIGKNWDEKRGACKRVSILVDSAMILLDSLGLKYNINSYIINQPIYNEILDGQKEADNYSDQLMNEALKIHHNALAKMKESEKYYTEKYKDDLLKIIGLQEDSWDNPICHRNENLFLLFIISQNKNYDIHLKKLLLEKGKYLNENK